MSEEVFQAKGDLMKSLYDDEEYSIQYKEYLGKSPDTIAPILPTEEHDEYEVTSDDKSECDVPVKDDSLFDDNDDFTSSDDESLPDKDVPIEEFKVNSNPLFYDDEINYDKLDPHCFNAECDFVESLSNRDTLIDSSPKFDYLEEFFGTLIPTSIADEERIRREHEEYISLMEREEIVIFTEMDNLLSPGIESDGYDSEGDIYFLEELLSGDSIPLPENDSSNSDHQDDPSFPRTPPKPPDVEFLFDFEPNSEVISAVMNNIDELNEDECFDPVGEIDVFANVEDDDYSTFIFVIRIFLPYLIYLEVSPLLLSAESEDTIFDPGIFV
nr:hypothetical protein [Tanacetum cinerariifolium]